MKKVAILQSNYLPWKGVFDLIHHVDIFVFLEDVQYTKNDWRNRNIILTNVGPKWITVPIKHNNKFGQLISEAEIDNKMNWQRKHFNSFQTYYGKAPFYKQYKWIIEDLYLEKKWNKLSELNIYAVKLIAQELNINTQFLNSCELSANGTKDDKVIDICKKVNADYYLSGPSAQCYLSREKFEKNGIELAYINYSYPEYDQLFTPFTHNVTILDLIFNCGPDTSYYIWGWREQND